MYTCREWENEINQATEDLRSDGPMADHLTWGERDSDDNLFEYDGPCRTEAAYVRNRTVPVYSRLGSHPFSAWPKHVTPPLL